MWCCDAAKRCNLSCIIKTMLLSFHLTFLGYGSPVLKIFALKEDQRVQLNTMYDEAAKNHKMYCYVTWTDRESESRRWWRWGGIITRQFPNQTIYEEQSRCTQQRGTLTNWALFQRCLMDWWTSGNLCIHGSKEEKNDHTNYLQIFEGLSYEKFIMTFQDTEQGPLKTWGTLLNKVIHLITKHQCSSQGLSNQKLDDQVQML